MTRTEGSEAASSPDRANGTLAGGSWSLRDMGDLDREIRGWVRERPLLTFGLAVLTGYVAGKILARI